MNRQYLTTEIQTARDELQRLRDERLKLTPGDREGGARFRTMIAAANADLADLEAELKQFDLVESSAERKAERARGRASAAALVKAAGDSTKLWTTLMTHLAAARATATELKALGQANGETLKAALAAHSDRAGATNTLSLLIAPASGSDTMTAQALAEELKSLIDEMPGSFRITSEYIQPNHHMFSFATPGPRPTVLDARRRAVQVLKESLATVCAEPTGVTA